MNVRPQRENRKDEVDPTRLRPGIGHEQRHEAREQGIGEGLGPKGAVVQSDEIAPQHYDGHRTVRRAEPTRGHGEGDVRSEKHHHSREEHEPPSVYGPKGVDAELSKPLLVDPVPTRGEDGQVVVTRQPRMADDPSPQHGIPRVDGKSTTEETELYDQHGADTEDEERIALEKLDHRPAPRDARLRPHSDDLRGH